MDQTTTAYGIDLAGYSTGKSGFAKAARSSSSIEVTIYRNHALADTVDGTAQLAEITEPEIELISNCCSSGRTFIDIPIHLQDLCEPWNSVFVWQLTKRPVDLAFSSLPALADRIGSPLARFRNLLHCIRDRDAELVRLGTNLFETYPAGSLELLGLPRKGYKNQRIEFIDGKWQGETLAVIANGLGMRAPPDTSLNDDDVDACICAITGVVSSQDVLVGESLANEIRNRLTSRLPPTSVEQISTKSPDGYVLLRRLDEQLIIDVIVEDTGLPFAD